MNPGAPRPAASVSRPGSRRVTPRAPCHPSGSASAHAPQAARCAGRGHRQDVPSGRRTWTEVSAGTATAEHGRRRQSPGVRRARWREASAAAACETPPTRPRHVGPASAAASQSSHAATSSASGQATRLRHARRLGADVEQREDGGEGQDRCWCRYRRVAAQDTVRRYGLRPDGQDAPPPPRISEGCATTEERVDRGNLGPHEAAEEPMLIRAPSPAFFAREDQILDLR